VKPENLPEHLRRVHAASADADRAERRRRVVRPPRASLRMTRRTWAFLGVVLVLGAAVYAWSQLGGSAPEPIFDPTTPITATCMQHQKIVRHDHARLTIAILDSPYPIPANIGIVSADCMRLLHTHDGSGTIHIESPVPHGVRELTLREFFVVWGQPLSSTQVLSYVADATHAVTLTVDGVPDTSFGNLILRNGQDIVIEYRQV
jgi:hypothetical protein